MADNYDRYESDRRQENEFDPFEKVKPMNSFEPAKHDFARNGDNYDQPPAPLRPYHHDNQQQQQQQQKRHPFSRDFIDSMFTVVDKDLLFCKLFYFFFFGAFGSLFPLLAIYFKQLGMSAAQSGVLIGFRPFIEFLSAPFWGGLADKWRRGKEMLLFALLCWIVFTLAIAFVKPPAHKCLAFNGTHNILEETLGNRRRRDVPSGSGFSRGTAPSLLSSSPLSSPSLDALGKFDGHSYRKNSLFHGGIIFDKEGDTLPFSHGYIPSFAAHSPFHQQHGLNNIHYSRHIPRVADFNKSPRHSKSRSSDKEQVQTQYQTNEEFFMRKRFSRNVLSFSEKQNFQLDTNKHGKPQRFRRAPYKPDVSKIANVNSSDIKGLVFNMHSTVVYKVSIPQSFVYFVTKILLWI